MNLKLQRINDCRFSVRFCAVMKHYGIKTVGKACEFLNKHYDDRHVKSGNNSTVSIKILVRELDNYIHEQLS